MEFGILINGFYGIWEKHVSKHRSSHILGVLKPYLAFFGQYFASKGAGKALSPGVLTPGNHRNESP
jgi:hypothetical protein